MRTRNLMLAGLFATLLILSSYVVIPIGPVPITLQPFVVMLVGFLLGKKWGPISILVWIVLGCLGLPVFNQGQAGAVMLVGPTGGFILGFVVSAYLVGLFTERDQKASLVKNVGYLSLSMVVTYIIGLVGFMLSFTYFLEKPMTLERAVILAVAPFLPFDIIKAVIAAFVGMKVRKALIASGLYNGNKLG